MRDKPIARAEIPVWGLFAVLLFGAAFFGFMTWLTLRGAFDGPYPQLPELIIGGFFICFGLVCLGGIFFLDRAVVYGDRIEVRSPFGYTRRTIMRRRISSWREIHRSGRPFLILRTDTGEYCLSSEFCNNYVQLKLLITKGIPGEPEVKRQAR